jgi:hypothetical protein
MLGLATGRQTQQENRASGGAVNSSGSTTLSQPAAVAYAGNSC